MKATEIQKLRLRLRLTQKEFAGRLGVDAITVSRWERGIQKPKPVHLRGMERLKKKAGK